MNNSYFRMQSFTIRQIAYVALCVLIIPPCIVFKTWTGLKMSLIPSRFLGVLAPSNTSNFTIGSPEQVSEFWNVVKIALFWIIINAFANSFFNFSKKNLYLCLRKNVTRKIMKYYMRGNNFYHASFKLDNPDQRLDMDLDRLVRDSSDMVIKLCENIYGVVFYTFQVVGSVETKYILGAYALAAIGILLNSGLLPFQIKMSKRVEEAQGNYRYQQVRITKNSEVIALSQGSKLEGKIADTGTSIKIFIFKIFMFSRNTLFIVFSTYHVSNVTSKTLFSSMLSTSFIAFWVTI